MRDKWSGGVGVDDRMDRSGEGTGVAPSFLFVMFSVSRLSAERT